MGVIDLRCWCWVMFPCTYVFSFSERSGSSCGVGVGVSERSVGGRIGGWVGLGLSTVNCHSFENVKM